MEPKDVTERLSSHNKTLTGEDLLLMKSKESGFLRWTLLLVGEDVVTIAVMTTKVLEYYMNFVDKGAAEFERTDSNLEKVLQ